MKTNVICFVLDAKKEFCMDIERKSIFFVEEIKLKTKWEECFLFSWLHAMAAIPIPYPIPDRWCFYLQHTFFRVVRVTWNMHFFVLSISTFCNFTFQLNDAEHTFYSKRNDCPPFVSRLIWTKIDSCTRVIWFLIGILVYVFFAEIFYIEYFSTTCVYE